VPILPESVDHTQAFVLAGFSIFFGLLIRLLPWHRWPFSFLHVVPLTGLTILCVAGGYIDGSMEYYALFFPLTFIFTGSVFRPRASLLHGVIAAGGLPLSLLGAQSSDVIPFYVLGLVLAVAAGLILAHGRIERRSMTAMRHLLDAAAGLGVARDHEEVGAILAPILFRLVDADDCLVALRRGDELALIGGPRHRVQGAGSMAGLAEWAVSARRTVRACDLAGARSTVAVAAPIPGSTKPHGALIVVFSGGRAPHDGFAQRMMEQLATETGRVLDRLEETAVLIERAETDPLTGLGNRAVLREALSRLSPGDAFVLCDMDHFKHINDTMGHVAGDNVLVAFASCLRELARDEADTVVRYGGEEFAMILPGAGSKGALLVLDRLRARWADLRPLATFSSGVAVHEAGRRPQVTVEQADLALYRAKVSGRDRDELAVTPQRLPWRGPKPTALTGRSETL
jgi:diguanylate cyclase (GGDEF)-like protein